MKERFASFSISASFSKSWHVLIQVSLLRLSWSWGNEELTVAISGANPNLDEGMSFDDGQFSRNGSLGRIRPPDRRRGSIFEDWSGSPARQARKRPRQRNPITEDDDVPMTVSSRKGIKVGDCDSVWSFYEQRFKNCQQTACKLIAKAWVKAVEPKKQSTHPYTGSDEKAPDWWPKPWGPTKDDKVRHKEPDHLYKRGE